MTFTPDADFNGVATFSYTVTDGNLVSNTATVTVNVAPVNDAPVAQNDAVTVSEDVPFSSSISLLANDMSLASRLMLELNGTSSLTVTASFWATGASFTGATLTVTVAVLETRLPSVTV
ncbi:cadherin-like domain-containing protein [Pseudomonas stutzeri]|nr:cadherin-like domain-containing protein [Stutzerimonas stutzeri]